MEFTGIFQHANIHLSVGRPLVRQAHFVKREAGKGGWVDGNNNSNNKEELGVSKNNGTPKWIVYNGKPY